MKIFSCYQIIHRGKDIIIIFQTVYFNCSANDNASATVSSLVKDQLPKAAAQSSAAFDLLGLSAGSSSMTSDNLNGISLTQKLPQASSNKKSAEISSQLDLLCIGGTFNMYK